MEPDKISVESKLEGIQHESKNAENAAVSNTAVEADAHARRGRGNAGKDEDAMETCDVPKSAIQSDSSDDDDRGERERGHGEGRNGSQPTHSDCTVWSDIGVSMREIHLFKAAHTLLLHKPYALCMQHTVPNNNSCAGDSVEENKIRKGMTDDETRSFRRNLLHLAVEHLSEDEAGSSSFADANGLGSSHAHTFTPGCTVGLQGLSNYEEAMQMLVQVLVHL